MRIVGVVAVLVVALGVARADTPQQCKASADCGANAVCTAEGKCIALPPTTPPPEPPKPAGPSQADQDAAKLHFEQGAVMFNQANFSGALAEFQASYKLNPLPFVLKNIAFAHQKLFQHVEAYEALQQVIKQLPAGDPELAEVTLIADDLRKVIVDVKLTVVPDKTVIKIDGRLIGTAPLAKPLLIATGNRTIEFTLDGYEPVRRDLVVASGVPVDLGKVELKLIPKTGKARINSPVPRATVSIDGQPRGPVPIEVELSGGGHQIEVTAPDYQTHRGDLNITVGQTRDVNISLDKVIVVAKAGKPWYKKWYVVAPISAVVVGGGIGTYLIVTGTPDPIAGTLAPGAGKIQ